MDIPSIEFDHAPDEGYTVQLQLLSPSPSTVSDSSRCSEYSTSTASTDDGSSSSAVDSGIIKSTTGSPKRKDNRSVRQRKSHHKSKQGCLDCKSRRIKCDETKPSCQNCDKKGIRCEYPKPVKRPIVFAAPVILTPSAMGLASPKPEPAQSVADTDSSDDKQLIKRRHTNSVTPLYAQVDLPETNLMRVFDNETAEALMMPDLWREAFIGLATKYDFAMCSLLMFSAGHVARQTCGPNQHSLRVQELEYRQNAIELMRTQLDTQKPSNEAYDALFGTSLLLAFHSCSFSNYEVLDPTNDAFLFMLNGVKQIAKHMWIVRHISAFKRLFTMPLATKLDESLRYGFESLFDGDVDDGSPETGPGEIPKIHWEIETRYQPDYQIYRRVLASLLPLLDAVYGQSGYISADPGSATFCALVAWPILQADRFFALIRMGDPKALILAAHYYAALLKLEPGCSWWLYDRPREMCRAICYRLGEEYRQFLKIPLDMIDSVDGNNRQRSPDSPQGTARRWFKPNIPLTKPRYTVLERLTVSGAGEKKWVFC